MRTLCLVRHAKSSWDNPALRDAQRPLNERGLRDAPRMAKTLAATGLQPDLLVSSPAKRAWTTAVFFAQAFGLAETDIVPNSDIYEAAPIALLRIISALPDTAQTILLFGHNPTFTEVANLFSAEPIDNVPTCGIVQLESAAPTWAAIYEGNTQVHSLYFPKNLL